MAPKPPAAPKDQAGKDDGKGDESWLSHNPWLVVALASLALAALVVGIYLGAKALDDSTKGVGNCPKQQETDLASGKSVRWKLSSQSGNGQDGRPTQRTLEVALDDYVGEARRSATFVSVQPATTAQAAALPSGHQVGAFVLGDGNLTDGSRSMGFPVTALATRAPDGRAVNVVVCADRPEERHLSAPGRYKGIVRVAGPQIKATDIPVQVTIKAARTENIILVVIVALLGAILGVANSKNTDLKEDEAEDENKLAKWVLGPLPFVTGLVAGVLAGLVIYFDDPTFADIRGDDTAKLIVATFAAATGGLTVAAPASRGLRRKLARKPTPTET